ncbi:HD-GYP domain-containing protein [Uliginosibacterium sediminicola]|uniref:HD domain-containing phosphohydrolase n=1 Tax=Uliginosibacterium sediminicola TaxID=2024550 RepID=A0ABU9Z2B7_9RHOO
MEQSDPAYAALHSYTQALAVALAYRDLLTRLHSERVLGLAQELGEGLGLSAEQMGLLRIAASFHDIGKIGTPDRILFKTSELNAEEWRQMQAHSAIGEEIIAATLIDGAQEAARIIRHHHEHYDGQGYPDRLAGEDIPLLARIISIADSYDAMAESRSYQNAKPHGEIMRILQAESGSKHDPELMRAFAERIEHSSYKAASK